MFYSKTTDDLISTRPLFEFVNQPNQTKEKKEILGDLKENILGNLYKSTVKHLDVSKERDLVSLIIHT